MIQNRYFVNFSVLDVLFRFRNDKLYTYLQAAL